MGEIMADTLFFVVPCFNEEENILKTAEILGNEIESLCISGVLSRKSGIIISAG